MSNYMGLFPKQTILCGIRRGSTLGHLLFLIYINDLPNCSGRLNFKIFAVDTNIFASTRNLETLVRLINSELMKVKKWCDINKLSINMKKTNLMMIKSVKKRTLQSLLKYKIMMVPLNRWSESIV